MRITFLRLDEIGKEDNAGNTFYKVFVLVVKKTVNFLLLGYEHRFQTVLNA